mmetsp:Transcript_26158/g.42870  ORF Transcript_26158/g.42870 Transcript_26158/m.42870 type:complete len:119 (+) Transcript_26158:147-503(+)
MSSLPPYLAFLYKLKQKVNEGVFTKGVFDGFAFLLVFLAVAIPSGIYTRIEYGQELMNVDFIHGPAESFLTISNLWTAIALRRSYQLQKRRTVLDKIHKRLSNNQTRENFEPSETANT